MREKISYRDLNWEYDFTTETKTVRRRKQWVGEEHKFLNIYTADGNKIMTYEYPTWVKIVDMEIIHKHIDLYLIRARKKKLNKLKNLNK